MDVVEFVLLGTAAGVGGGTAHDLLLGIQILWIERPICFAVALALFFTARLISE